jgi:hypothetical protein
MARTAGGGLAQTAIRETESHTPQEFRRRVRHLATAYVALFVASSAGMALLVWQAQLYVALAQRSNVETLVLAFLFVFFGYVAFLSAPGVVGAARIGYYALLVRLGRDPVAVERQKARALGQRGRNPPAIALNLILEKEGCRGQPFTLEVADEAGPAGKLEVDGAQVTHTEAFKDGSNSLMAFFVHQVNEVLQERGEPANLDIVTWRKIDDEATEQHLSLVRFARNLERRLDAEELWPKLWLTDADCRELERRLAQICPALRNEAFLPDWEYEGQHQVPLIPEPLGLVRLQRRERRVDPVASMGCAVLVVGASLLALLLFVLSPPWVPGK